MYETTMIGYHYTTAKNWKRIKKNGLVPKCSSKTPENVDSSAIWFFKRQLRGNKLLGTVMDVAIRHNDTNIICVRTKFKHVEGFIFRDRMISKTFGHNVKINFCTEKIPPEHLTVVGQWTLKAEEQCDK